nr:titin-like [Aedes albopictus]
MNPLRKPLEELLRAPKKQLRIPKKFRKPTKKPLWHLKMVKRKNSDAVEVVDSNEGEPVQEKTDNATANKKTVVGVVVSDEEKQETVVTKDEEPVQEKLNDNVDGSAAEGELFAVVCEEDKPDSVSEEDKQDAISEEDKLEATAAEATVEEQAEETQDTEMDSTEVEQTEPVKTCKENENKENESPKEIVLEAVESVDTTVVDAETDKNDEDEQAEHSEAMEVDAQLEDKVKTISTEEEAKSSETGEISAPSKAIEEDPLADSTVENSAKDDQVANTSQLSIHQSLKLKKLIPRITVRLKNTSLTNLPLKKILEVKPKGGDQLAQIEDFFLKLQETIDSTEEATGESAADLPAEADQDMAEEASAAASSEEFLAEQMEEDENAGLSADMITR